MGGKYSQLHYSPADCEIFEELFLFTKTFSPRHIRGLAHRLREVSWNFFLTPDQFEELLDLQKHPFLRDYVHLAFCMLKKTPESSKISGLEFLVGLALCSDAVATVDDKLACFFHIFDMDGIGLLSSDEVEVMLRLGLNAIGKFTKGLETMARGLLEDDTIQVFTKECLRCAEEDVADAQKIIKNAKGEVGITMKVFQDFMNQCKPISTLLRHFALHDSLNSNTFKKYHPRQVAAYETSRKMASYFTSNGSSLAAFRMYSAAMRIQAIFRMNKSIDHANGIRGKMNKRMRRRRAKAAGLIQRAFRQKRMQRYVHLAIPSLVKLTHFFRWRWLSLAFLCLAPHPPPTRPPPADPPSFFHLFSRPCSCISLPS
jgi:hypothetical protein